jgi:hypothetical protein
MFPARSGQSRWIKETHPAEGLGPKETAHKDEKIRGAENKKPGETRTERESPGTKAGATGFCCSD